MGLNDTDLFYEPVLDRYIELRCNRAVFSVRFIRPGDENVQKRTTKAGLELDEYFRGKRTEFTCDIDLSGMSDFTRKVLEETQKIRYGTVITYSELARRIGSRAIRAVGSALSRNPVPIIIPCHRVVAKNGIGGYSSGIDIKRRLIELELSNPGT